MLETNVPISVFDVSNAWWPTYIRSSEFQKLLALFNDIAEPDAILLLTNGDYPHWTYHGMTLKFLRQMNLIDFHLRLGMNISPDSLEYIFRLGSFHTFDGETFSSTSAPADGSFLRAPIKQAFKIRSRIAYECSQLLIELLNR